MTRAADRQRREFQAEKVHQKEVHEAEAAVRHKEIMESRGVEAERIRKADAMTAALMAVILNNQEEAAKGREIAARQSEALEALMKERAAPTGASARTELDAVVAPPNRLRGKRLVGAEMEQN